MTAISSAFRLGLANLEFINRDGHKENLSRISSAFPHLCHEAGTPGVLCGRNSPWQERPEEEQGGDSVQHG